MLSTLLVTSRMKPIGQLWGDNVRRFLLGGHFPTIHRIINTVNCGKVAWGVPSLPFPLRFNPRVMACQTRVVTRLKRGGKGGRGRREGGRREGGWLIYAKLSFECYHHPTGCNGISYVLSPYLPDVFFWWMLLGRYRSNKETQPRNSFDRQGLDTIGQRLPRRWGSPNVGNGLSISLFLEQFYGYDGNGLCILNSYF